MPLLTSDEYQDSLLQLLLEDEGTPLDASAQGEIEEQDPWTQQLKERLKREIENEAGAGWMHPWTQQLKERLKEGFKGDKVKDEGKGEGALSTDLTTPPRDKGKAEGALSTDLATPTLDEAEQERRARRNTIARLHRFNSVDREAQEHVLGDGLREVPVEGCKGKGDMVCSKCRPLGHVQVQTPWPCAWCNLEPHDAVWRPLDGATPFDTEERVCDACWKGVKGEGKGKGKGDKVKGEGKGKRSKPQGPLEDPVEDASSDEGPSSDEGRKGKGGKLEKSKGKGKDGKLEKGKSKVGTRILHRVEVDEQGWVVDGRRRWSKEWFLRMVRAGKLNGHELDWQGLIDVDVVAGVLLDEFIRNNNEEYAGDDNEEHAGDVDGTDNTSDADATLWAPTPDPEARDDELGSEPPRKCGRLV